MFLVLKDKDTDRIIAHLNNLKNLVIETETNRRINLRNKMILRNLIFNRTIIPYGELDENGNILNMGILNLSSENSRKNYITVQFIELRNREFLNHFIDFATDYCKKNNFGKIKIILNPKVMENSLNEAVCIIKNYNFEKEIEYNNMLGRQMIYARFIEGN